MSHATQIRALIAAGALLCPAAAQAATHLTLSLTGTVSPGSYGDAYHYSGEVQPATNFDGNPINWTFHIVRDGATTYVEDFNARWSNDPLSPYLVSWSDSRSASFPGFPYGGFPAFEAAVNLGDNGGSIHLLSTIDYITTFDAGILLDLSFTFSSPHSAYSSFSDDAIGGGGYFFSRAAFAYSPVFGEFSARSRGDFTLTSLTQRKAVPEPGTWALLLLGFSGVGVALRARRRPRAPVRQLT